MQIKPYINLQKAFPCRICNNIAQNPMVAKCCDYIACQTCIQAFCPDCKAKGQYYKSQIIFNIYDNTFIPCNNGCDQIFNLNYYSKHQITCPQSSTKCGYCKQMLKIKNITEHLTSTHSQEYQRMLIDFHKKQQKKVSKVEILPPLPIFVQKIKPFRFQNNEGNSSTICLAGRMTCGKPLFNSIVRASSIARDKRNICCLQNGSCDKCMELDITRLGLPKSYLLNFEGRICRYIANKRKIICGSTFYLLMHIYKVCNEDEPCIRCQQTLELIQKGLYSKLIA